MLSNRTKSTPYTLNTGFTVLELVVVLAVAGILAMLALPSAKSFLLQARVDSELALLHRTVSAARTSALQKGVSITLCPLKSSVCQADWNQELSLFVDQNRNRVRDNGEEILLVLDAVIAADTREYPRTAVTFRADGALDGFLNGTFVYCPERKDHPESSGIVVSQTGRVRPTTTAVDCT